MYVDAEKWDFSSYNQDATTHTGFWTGPATQVFLEHYLFIHFVKNAITFLITARSSSYLQDGPQISLFNPIRILP